MSLRKSIDWSQLWYPGPKRAFTAEEMALAGSEPVSPTTLVVVSFNVALLVLGFLLFAPAEYLARLTGLAVMLTISGLIGARTLWQRPWRKELLRVSLLYAGMMLLMAVAVRWRMPERDERYWIALLLVCGGVLTQFLLWFLVVWRSQQIESRLKELAERKSAIEMARRLASAQLEPHFLFNTLASLQHWVQTKDDRAAPLLSALTGYLRATLPLFNRPLLPLQDELAAVQRYLQVMQLRMGERLLWTIDVPDELQSLPLPPGMVLTLVENAVVHGVEPQISGGRVQLTARHAGTLALIEVQDNGPGSVQPMPEGTGLANIRERLQLTYGHQAQLVFTTPSTGGLRAQITLPMRAT
jgi:hypothetical protein